MSAGVSLTSVKLTAHVHATEDSAKVGQALQNLCPPGFPDPKVRVAKGHYGNEIKTLNLESPNRKMAETFLVGLWNRLPSLDRVRVLDELSQYVDDAGHLFLRVDKQLAFEGISTLRDTEPIRIELSFNARSLDRHSLIVLIRERLVSLGCD